MATITRNDTKSLLGLIVTAYPNSKIAATNETVDLWFDMLQDLPSDLAAAATKSMIATLKFPPTIADIRSAVVKISAEARGELTAGDALALVRKAMRLHGYYDATGARKMLGERLWGVVRMVAPCWEDLCVSEDDNWGARFERLYKGQQEHEHELLQIPGAVQERMRAMVGDMTKRLTGGEGEHG